jgi:hypothetical protein
MSVPLEKMIACVKREIAMRKIVYPKWVDSGRMKQATADSEIEAMTAVLHLLMELEHPSLGNL